jgi:hypothetical protein
MQKRGVEIHRKVSAEAEWRQVLKEMHAFLSRKK